MANEFDYNKLIEDYLSGRLSESDRIGLENRIAIDPDLRSEFELQKNILTVIRDSRKAELKASLSSVHIPWYHMIPMGLKIATSVSLLTLAGLSTYYFIGRSSEKPGVATQAQILKPAGKSVKPAEVKPSQETFRTEENKVAQSSSARERRKQKMGIPKTKEIKPAEGEVSDIPPVHVPVPVMNDSAGNAGSKPMAFSELERSGNPASVSTLEPKLNGVNIRKTKDYNFDYSFIEGSLTLYGDFSACPYKILEINSSSRHEFFLLYNSLYYSLKQDTKGILPLEPITDNGLINQLNILKDNK